MYIQNDKQALPGRAKAPENKKDGNMRWIIRDDETGEILAEFNGTRQEAMDMFRSLADKIPDDGHTWSLYERVDYVNTIAGKLYDMTCKLEQKF